MVRIGVLMCAVAVLAMCGIVYATEAPAAKCAAPKVESTACAKVESTAPKAEGEKAAEGKPTLKQLEAESSAERKAELKAAKAEDAKYAKPESAAGRAEDAKSIQDKPHLKDIVAESSAERKAEREAAKVESTAPKAAVKEEAAEAKAERKAELKEAKQEEAKYAKPESAAGQAQDAKSIQDKPRLKDIAADSSAERAARLKEAKKAAKVESTAPKAGENEKAAEGKPTLKQLEAESSAERKSELKRAKQEDAKYAKPESAAGRAQDAKSIQDKPHLRDIEAESSAERKAEREAAKVESTAPKAAEGEKAAEGKPTLKQLEAESSAERKSELKRAKQEDAKYAKPESAAGRAQDAKSIQDKPHLRDIEAESSAERKAEREAAKVESTAPKAEGEAAAESSAPAPAAESSAAQAPTAPAVPVAEPSAPAAAPGPSAEEIAAAKAEQAKAQAAQREIADKMAAAEQKLTAAEQKLTAAEQKLEATERRLGELEAKVNTVCGTVEETGKSVYSITAQLKQLETVSRQIPAQPPAVQIKPYGYIKVDAAYDSGRTASGDAPPFVLSEKPGFEDDRQFTMTARQTRIGMDIYGPEVNGGKNVGKVEVDFYGPPGTQEFKAINMLRQAYWQYSKDNWNVLAGQTWEVVSPGAPNMLNYTYLADAGNPGYRRPMVRYERVDKAGVASFKSDVSINCGVGPGISGAAGPDDEASDSGWPVVEGREGVSFPTNVGKTDTAPGKPVIVGLSGAIGQLEYDTATSGHGPKFTTYVANLDWTVPVATPLDWTGEFYSGRNSGGFFGSIGQFANITDHKDIDSLGGWTQLNYRPATKWLIGLGTGIDQNENADLSNAKNENRAFNANYYTNAIYSLNEKTTVGVELSYLDTRYHGSPEGEDLRLQGAVQYNF